MTETLVYEELRRVARKHLRREREDHTLVSAALVNETYLRLVEQRGKWENRALFFAVAALAYYREAHGIHREQAAVDGNDLRAMSLRAGSHQRIGRALLGWGKAREAMESSGQGCGYQGLCRNWVSVLTGSGDAGWEAPQSPSRGSIRVVEVFAAERSSGRSPRVRP